MYAVYTRQWLEKTAHPPTHPPTDLDVHDDLRQFAVYLEAVPEMVADGTLWTD